MGAVLSAEAQFLLELDSLGPVMAFRRGQSAAALPPLLLLAARGSTIANFHLGLAHEKGAEGGRIDLARARQYYEAAAEDNGSAEAVYRLVLVFLNWN